MVQYRLCYVLTEVLVFLFLDIRTVICKGELKRAKTDGHIRGYARIGTTAVPSIKQHLRTTTNKGKLRNTNDEPYYFLDPYSIHRQLIRIIPAFPNANISVEVIGRTVEYNDIVLLKITERKDNARYRAVDETKYADDVLQKKIIFIVHGLSIMGFQNIPCLDESPYFIQLLSYYFEHLDKFDIFLIPLANPDGLNYPDLFWNKNVSPQKACPGVALDRNFDVAWNSSRLLSSCSQHYPGLVPFSEVETQVIRKIFYHYNHKIIAYIHVHAGGHSESTFTGEAVLYPKGYTDVQEDDDLYIDLKGEIDEAMRNASFRVMSVTVDTLQSWYGTISGSSVDYASTVYSVPFALEFVMQPYEKYFNFDELEHEIVYDSLNAIWGRIIDVVFKYIWHSTHNTENSW